MVLEEYRVHVEGPLERWARGFATALVGQGFTRLSICVKLRLLADASRWLESRGLLARQLTPERVEQLIISRRRRRYTASLSVRALAPMMKYLREVGAAPVARESSAMNYVDRVVGRYQYYLVNERGVGGRTVKQRSGFALIFLARHKSDPSIRTIGAGEIRQFIRRKTQGLSVNHAKTVANSLRSLLRFLHVIGLVPWPLVGAVPSVCGWRLQGVPKFVPKESVRKMLRSCDRLTLTGARDFAVLNLLIRLGLRKCEVVSLELEDINWRQGEIVVRGKGKSVSRLPLPYDVGDAISAYLSRRPTVAFRSVFLLKPAPRKPITPSSIASIVELASLRAGLKPVSPHKLRHTLATEVLRRGGSLAEVAELLRHKSLGTTAIYAKVDRTALRELAQPWPGGAL